MTLFKKLKNELEKKLLTVILLLPVLRLPLDQQVQSSITSTCFGYFLSLTGINAVMCHSSSTLNCQKYSILNLSNFVLEFPLM